MTIGGFAFERVFSMPTFEGVKILRAQVQRDPALSINEAVLLIRKVELDGAALDLEASAALAGLLPPQLPVDGAHFYRDCIRRILLAYQPSWTRTMLQGRSRFYATLERDEQSLFRQAGILDNPPDDGFVDWWDTLAGEMRLIKAAEMMVRGRAAERLTMIHEAERLQRQGIDAQPKWIGLDDNTKGYDVLSYELSGGTLINRMIEVKSTIASPIRFIVTRNEWEQANRSGPAYSFYIWDMQKAPPILHIRSVEQVRPHIPSDNEKGRWQNAEVPLRGA